jgi:hypothetical protein
MHCINNFLVCLLNVYMFQWLHPSGRIVTPRSTQPLFLISTRNLPWGVKAAGAQGWQPYHFHVPTVYKFWESRRPGLLRTCSGLYTESFTLFYTVWKLPLFFTRSTAIMSRLLLYEAVTRGSRILWHVSTRLYGARYQKTAVSIWRSTWVSTKVKLISEAYALLACYVA